MRWVQLHVQGYVLSLLLLGLAGRPFVLHSHLVQLRRHLRPKHLEMFDFGREEELP